MITFTKEQLIASAHARIEFAEMMLSGELEPLKERTWSIELELARIALASLEAEKKILYRERNPYNGMTTGWQELAEDEYEFIKDNAGENAEFRTVYTAPPAPVSVAEWTNEQCLEFLSIAFRHAEIKGDLELDDIRLGVKMVNGSRAAMLNQEKSNG
ncbi:hypothetical protein U9661_000988 [Enterobacter hormaechei]